MAGPIAATRGSGPARAAASSRAPFALVTTTQSYAGDVDRLVAERLDRDQRAVDDLVPELLEPRHEILRLPSGRVTTILHRRERRAAPPRAPPGRRPLRRSIQVPSSAAISAVSVAPSWWAATGARQPPPISATHRRSASTRSPRLGVVDRGATSSSSPARTCSASAPWPGLGQHHVRIEPLPDLAPEPQPV